MEGGRAAGGGAQPGPSSLSGPTYFRAKVYRLNVEGNWMDKGTGHICVEYLEQAESHGLVVISEDGDGKALLVHKISKEDIYQRTGETTIINWHDPDVNTDIAISFQEQSGCDFIWQQIKQVQRENQHPDTKMRRHMTDDYEQTTASQYEEAETGVDLPAPEIGNLEEIAKVITSTPPFQRDRIGQAIMKPGYIAALLDIFRQCEDLEDGASLAHLYRIIKTTIMLNDATLLEDMLKEEHVMDIVGALEYDPDFKAPQRHREFLQSCVQFKEVVPIADPAIMAKIHQTYRIQYIKDVILPRSLDDATYTTLSSLALFNNVEVVTALQSDPRFLPELFLRLERHTPGDAEWGDLIAFLQEFCSLARHLQPQQRQQLFSRLVQLGLFEIATRILKVSPDAVKLKATDILMSVTQHDVAALRDFLLHQSDHMLFTLLVRELTEGSDGTGLPEQISELLKTLLDPDTMETAIEKNEFVELFYDKYVHQLLQVIVLDRAINAEGTRLASASILGLIVDLFCFFVQNHSYRVKYYVLRSHMIEKVLRVVRRRERWLACAGVRFLRTCITIKDEFFTRYMVRNNVFEPVMTVFFENGDRYNLLNSAVLDILDYVRKESLKMLVDHLVEHFGHRFDDVDYVDTLRQLRLKYDQMHEVPDDAAGGGGDGGGGEPSGDGSVGGALRGRTFVFGTGGDPVRGPSGRAAARRRGDERGLDKDEEDYFNSSDDGDEDEGPGASPQQAAGTERVGGSGTPVSPPPSGGAGGDAAARSRGPSAAEHSGRQAMPASARGDSGSPDAAAAGGSLRLVEYDDDDNDSNASNAAAAVVAAAAAAAAAASGGRHGDDASTAAQASTAGGVAADHGSRRAAPPGASEPRKAHKVAAGDSPGPATATARDGLDGSDNGAAPGPRGSHDASSIGPGASSGAGGGGAPRPTMEVNSQAS